MQALEKRIVTLEQAIRSDVDDVTFIHFINRDEVDKETQRITRGGQEWERQSGESEQAFKDRAQQGSKPNPNNISVFFCH